MAGTVTHILSDTLKFRIYAGGLFLLKKHLRLESGTGRIFVDYM